MKHPIKISREEATRKDRENMKAWYYQLPEHETTFAYAEQSGEHGNKVVGDKPRFYYILEGEGKFIVNDEEIMVEKGDLLAIPPHSKYNFFTKNKTEMKFIVFLELLDIAKIPTEIT